MQAFETSRSPTPMSHTSNKVIPNPQAAPPSENQAFKYELTGTTLIQASFTLILFNFTDQTKITYKAAATEDAIPAALEKGTHNGNIPPIQPGPSPNGLNSGQMAN